MKEFKIYIFLFMFMICRNTLVGNALETAGHVDFFFSTGKSYYQMDMCLPSTSTGLTTFDHESSNFICALNLKMPPDTYSLALKLQNDGVKKNELLIQAQAVEQIAQWHGPITAVNRERFFGYSIVHQSKNFVKSSRYNTEVFLCLDNIIYVRVSILSGNKDETKLLDELYSGLAQAKIKYFGKNPDYKSDNNAPITSELPTLKSRIQQLVNAEDNKEFLAVIPQREILAWEKKAAQNDPEALLLYSACYIEGVQRPKEIQKGMELLQKSAEQNLAEAQLWLGLLYIEKEDTTSQKDGFHWLFRAAQQENAEAEFLLGGCYDDGIGVPQNYQEAVKWYQKALAHGFLDAQVRLALCYLEGRGTEKNLTIAVKLMQSAAERGGAPAQFYMGLFYSNGTGVKIDNQQSFYMWAGAAVQGYADAQFCLGSCYENGIGTVKNDTEAIKWYRKSAAEGNVDAIKKLAQMRVKL